MPRRNPEAVCAALTELKKFFVYFGKSDYTRIQLIDLYIHRLKNERLDAALVGEIESFIGEVYIQTREQIRGGRLLPGPRNTEEATSLEWSRVFLSVNRSLNPQPEENPLPHLDVTGFAGSEFVQNKSVLYEGSPGGVREIFEKTVATVRRHTEAVTREDFQSAYSALAPSLKSGMALDRFIAAHATASREYGGTPIDYRIYGVGPLLADEQARSRFKNVGPDCWPKTASRTTWRSIVHGFWIRNKEQHGCAGDFWLTEEAGEYVIAKFDFAAP